MSDLGHLAIMSRRLGANPAYVQGGGGNTSIKVDGERMWIKASGFELASADPDTSFVAVAHQAIREGILRCRHEADYMALVANSVLSSPLADRTPRPSIETGFHALLGPAVLHTHSIWTNLLTCSLEGKQIAHELMPQSLWIPYAAPGLAVTRAIAERLVAPSETGVLLLENHGLIVAGGNLDAALALHEEVNEKVQRHFSLALDEFADCASQFSDVGWLLFPDQAVYLASDVLRSSKAGRETQWAYDALCNGMRRLGLSPKFLPAGEGEALLAMESEKHRQKVLSQ